MWFGLMGPLQVRHDDAELLVPAAKQRILLAAVLLTPGSVVSSARLKDLIWNGCPPAGAAVTLRSYVGRLRQTLGPAGQRIVTADNGYLIKAAEDEIDLSCYARLCSRGEAALQSRSWQQAATLLHEAEQLWRGSPLADIPCQALKDTGGYPLEQLRQQATQWRIEADLQLGQASTLVPQLYALTAKQPLLETFHRQLMVALYRSGRRADALAAYRHARDVLVSEIGVEPGPELQILHRQILNGDTGLLAAPPGAAPPTREPGPVRPRQLPPPVPNFAGRAGEIRTLDELASTHGHVVVVDGMPGVGKTSLAVYWSHRVAGSFPDGQLYLNLHGFGPAGTPVTPMDALTNLLRALQVNAAQTPATFDSSVGLYRSLLAGRRMLIVLDNAKDADQVRPLLPGEAGCLVLITSRTKLAGLVALQGVCTVSLAVLSPADAQQMIANRLGAGRAAADPVATSRLIDVCARLPLALAIATALIATQPGASIAGVARELESTASRLDALDAGEAAANLRAVFASSYVGLTAPAAHMFSLLSEHPGPDITVAAAASLTGTTTAQAKAALATLVTANLVSMHSGRFALHDLLREYAASQLQAMGGASRKAAGLRMLGHYSLTAAAAARAISPARDLPDMPEPAPGTQPEPLAGQEAALAWLRDEHQVLMRVMSYAAGTGQDEYAWRLPLALTDFHDRAGHWHDWITAQRVALAAAQRLDDICAQARAHRYIGRASFHLRRHDDALEHLTRALTLRHQLGQPGAQAGIHADLSRVHEHRGHRDEALRAAQQALQLYQAIGHRTGEAYALNGVGWQHALHGSFTDALAFCTAALQMSIELDLQVIQAQAWDSVGYIRHHMGEPELAIGSYQRSIDLLRQLGDQFQLSRALTHLGDAHQAAGDPGEAAQAWLGALAILHDLDHPDADHVQARLSRPSQATIL
jgi:DNA-binding SARP family transcriptional activator/tetratricopeptide (TPR) repeat protein